MEALSQNDPTHVAERPSAKSNPSLWVKLSDIHKTKVIFVKDQLPDSFSFAPVAMAPSLSVSRPSAKTTKPLA
jgi:hypothetical protein